MIRRSIGLLFMAALSACTKTEAPTVGTARATIVPVPGASSYAFSKDGRLAYGSYVMGKYAIFVSNADGTNAKRVSFGVWDEDPRWSPDGKSIVFSRDQGGQGDVVMVPADSGAERVIASTAAHEVGADFLPDGSGIVFMRRGEHGYSAWVFRLADGTTSKLFDADGSVNAMPSRDGKWIAYSLLKNGKSTIWVWDTEKKTHRQLTTEGFENLGIDCFSPDSHSILYDSRRTGTSDLWRVDVATGERTQLTQDVANDASGRWSPDGKRIAFLSNRGGQSDIWVLSTGEADVQRVTDDANAEVNPLWTLDGGAVIASVPPNHTHVYSLPIAGGAPVALTSGDWDVVETAAEVSHDGSNAAYAGSKNGDPDIWIVPVAGGESRLIAGGPGYDVEPTWSPDGKRIAFTSVRSGNADIWIASVDGSTPPTRFTDWPSIEGAAKWSPDGNTIAFLSGRDSPGQDLWTMPAGGGSPKRLTTFGAVNPNFRWSADSRAVAFAAPAGATSGMTAFTVPAAGGSPTLIAPAISRAPAWSPDGREIAIAKCNLGYCGIEVRSTNGKLTRTLNAGGAIYEVPSYWSADGSQILVLDWDYGVDGRSRTSIRPAAGGANRVLEAPAGMATIPVGFAAGGKSAVAIVAPRGNNLQTIAVPAPVKAR